MFMGRRWQILWLGIVAFALTGIGCTRNAPNTSSDAYIHLDFSHLHMARGSVIANGNAAPTVSIGHIVVDIDGAVMGTWDAHDSTAGTPPSTFGPYTVNTGTHKTQVLLVMQDTTGMMQFEYGEWNGPDTDITPVLTIQGQSSGQAQVSGRYLSSANAGPTGLVGMYFNPGTGTPMLIQTTEMFGGYFSTFGLQNTEIQYQLPDGTFNFTGATSATGGVMINATSPIINSNMKAASAMIYVPTHYRNCTNDTGGGSVCPPSGVATDTANLNLYGFFGPGVVATDVMCIPNAAAPIQSGQQYSDNLLENQLSYSPSPLPSPVGTVAGPITGGVMVSGQAACSGTPFLSNFWIATDNMAEGDSALGFQGPYQGLGGQNGGNSYLTFANSGSSLSVTWNYLPGGTSGITGSEVFYKDITGQWNGSWGQPYHVSSSNGFLCSQLVTTYGFTSAGQVGIGTGAPPTTGSMLIANHSTNSNTEVIVCPYASTSYYQSGVDGNPAQSMGGPFYQLTWQADATLNAGIALGSSNFTQEAGSSAGANSCKAYDITISPSPTQAFSLNVTDMGVNGNYHVAFYPSTGCTGTPNGPIAVAAGQTTATVWIQSMGVMSGGFDSVSVNTNTAGVNVNSLQIPFALPYGTPSTPGGGFMIWQQQNNSSSANLAQGGCYPIEFELGSSMPGVFSSATTVHPTANGVAGTFYNDSNCSSSTTTFSIPANEGVGIGYFKPTATGAGYVSATSNQAGLTSFNPTQLMMNVGGNTPTQVTVGPMNGNSFAENGQCVQLWFNMQNNVGAPINNFSGTVPVNMAVLTTAVGSSAVYSDAACQTPASTSSLQVSYSTKLYYLTPTGPGEIDFMTTVSGQPTYTFAFSDLTNQGNGFVQAQNNTSLGMISAGATFNQSVLSIPALAVMNTCYPYYISLWSGPSPATYTSTITATISLSLTGTTGGGLFTDSACTSPAGGVPTMTVPISPGQASAVIYVMPGNTSLTASCNSLNPLISFTFSPTVSVPWGPATVCPN